MGQWKSRVAPCEKGTDDLALVGLLLLIPKILKAEKDSRSAAYSTWETHVLQRGKYAGTAGPVQPGPRLQAHQQAGVGAPPETGAAAWHCHTTATTEEAKRARVPSRLDGTKVSERTLFCSRSPFPWNISRGVQPAGGMPVPEGQGSCEPGASLSTASPGSRGGSQRERVEGTQLLLQGQAAEGCSPGRRQRCCRTGTFPALLAAATLRKGGISAPTQGLQSAGRWAQGSREGTALPSASCPAYSSVHSFLIR